MKKPPILPEEDKPDMENVLEFKKPEVVAGGKEPPEENWLLTLNKGCFFLARPRKIQQTTDFTLMQYIVITKLDRGVQLLVNVADNDQFFWVDSVRFSQTMELIEIVREGGE